MECGSGTVTDRSAEKTELWECRPCERRVEVRAGASYGWRCKVCNRHMRQLDTGRYYVAQAAVDAWKEARDVFDREVLGWVSDHSFFAYASKRLKPLLERHRG
jgi:ribosomal protein L37AE/L43A